MKSSLCRTLLEADREFPVVVDQLPGNRLGRLFDSKVGLFEVDITETAEEKKLFDIHSEFLWQRTN